MEGHTFLDFLIFDLVNMGFSGIEKTCIKFSVILWLDLGNKTWLGLEEDHGLG